MTSRKTAAPPPAAKPATATVKTPAAAKIPAAAKTPGARKKPAATRTPARARAAAAGDIGPTASAAGIESYAVTQAVDAAQEARLAAMRDLIAGAPNGEAVALLKALLQQQRMAIDQAAVHPDEELAPGWRDGGYPYQNLMSRRTYERQKYRLQVELLKLQAWVKDTGQKVVILFEGRDAAGKGGTIKRFMVLFDRSWYNRAGVERVMDFCSDPEYQEFMRQAPEFERMMVRNGIHLLKFWFSVSREEQRRRFRERKVHPLKRWKLSPIDLASLDKWEDYTKAKEAMFFYTDTADAPWTVIKSDCKKRARLNALRYVLHRLPYSNKDTARIGPLDSLIVGRANVVYERGEKHGVPIL